MKLNYKEAAKVASAAALLKGGFAATTVAAWNRAVQTLVAFGGSEAALVAAGFAPRRARLGSFGKVLLAAMKAAVVVTAKPSAFLLSAIRRTEANAVVSKAAAAAASMLRGFRAMCVEACKVTVAMRSEHARALRAVLATWK